MEAYKKAAGDLDTIMVEARSWIENSGKQTYKFPEDRKVNNPRCQLCEKLCYPAEKITYNSVPYHQNCLRCVFCHKKCSAADVSPVSEAAFVCNNHKQKVIAKGKTQAKIVIDEPVRQSRRAAAKASKEKKDPDIQAGIEWRAAGKKQSYKYPEDISGPNKRVDPRCHKCGKTVYPAEKFTYEMIPYHKACVRCLQCNMKLGPSNATPFGEEDFLCNNHYEKVIGKVSQLSRSRSTSAGGRGFEKTDDMSAGIEWKRSGKKQVYKYPDDLRGRPNPRCNFCGKTSYPAETVTYNGIPYHSFCFRCLRCGKKLNGGNANPFGDALYLCNNHFNGILMEIGSAPQVKPHKTKTTESMFQKDEHGLDPRMYKGYEWRVSGGKQKYKYPEDMKSSGTARRCNYCGKKSYPAETVTYELIPYHKSCFRCLKCNKRLTTATATPFGAEVFLCDAHFAQYGQGGGLPTKGAKASPVRTEKEIDEEEKEMAKLSAVERRRLRRKREKERKTIK